MEINEIQQIKQRFSIIGNAQSLLYAISRARTVAPFDQSVLITGESGVGKEFFPKIIHAFSPRKHKKYIAVNCGAIPEGTIDSELFGHEKGSFTGAVSSRKGYFEEANGGTIFLDEVAELPLTTQARLLRVLENGEFLKVGSSEVQKTDIRVVAATNRDMLKAVSEGKFREDLYYRLSTVAIEVPALRDRGDDILLLSRKFISDFAERYRTPLIEFTQDAKEALLHYRWPGNVRQLKNVVEQVALFNAGEKVTAEILKPHLPDYHPAYQLSVAGKPVFDYTAEREILFKFIFKLQHEIDELRSMIQDGNPTQPAKSKNQKLPHIEDVDLRMDETGDTDMFRPDDVASQDVADDAHKYHLVKIGDLPDLGRPMPVRENSVRTLEDTERATILESLKRNGGRRKATAEELDISERTLYRKIKEYGLE